MVTKQIKYRDFNKVNTTEMIEDMNLDSINLVSVIGWLSYETFLWHLRSY